ncbi:hypothetical protein KUCAC02_005733 [Chaenocephalus aceratus]|uniref:Uncharacterized protein n=1 Tax=Chaenocephalus aceratus TaxID=36190 RepID=A0ACB9WP67_CHAAC|nr:hypothetical protein KUCAC02_005733 [Chaenocephalus aceratus]
MASWKTEHRAQPVQSWTFREVFSGLVGNESTCIPKAVVAPSVVSTPPSVGKRTGSAEKEAERAQTKVGLCAPSTVDLWKIPRQSCAKMPGPARRDSGGMQLSSGGSPGLPGPKLPVPLTSQDREGALDTGPDKCAACSSWGYVRISRAAWTGPSLSNRSCVWFSILRES